MASIQTSEFFVEKAAVLALIDKLLSHTGDATLMDPWVAELASTVSQGALARRHFSVIFGLLALGLLAAGLFYVMLQTLTRQLLLPQ